MEEELSAHDIAPDFDAVGLKNYPSGGARIGPAWQRAWDLLADGLEHSKKEIVDAMKETGPIADKTAVNMLQWARRCEFIEMDRVTDREQSRVRRVWWRSKG